jgi:predicted benzoate:H+ symporter BenE
MVLCGHFTDFDYLRKSQRASFLRTISVKSGIEPVLLCQSNYTSTGWSTTSAIVLVSALKEQGNPKVCQKIQVYKGSIWNYLELFGSDI